jgi:hypothetical protein
MRFVGALIGVWAISSIVWTVARAARNWLRGAEPGTFHRDMGAQHRFAVEQYRKKRERTAIVRESGQKP